MTPPPPINRWRSHEVHDIVMECSRLSLDPLESSCEDELDSSREAPPPPASPLPALTRYSGKDLTPDLWRQGSGWAEPVPYKVGNVIITVPFDRKSPWSPFRKSQRSAAGLVLAPPPVPL